VFGPLCERIVETREGTMRRLHLVVGQM
jgi:hypothetical protein